MAREKQGEAGEKVMFMERTIKVTGDSFPMFINLTSLTQGDEENRTR